MKISVNYPKEFKPDAKNGTCYGDQ